MSTMGEEQKESRLGIRVGEVLALALTGCDLEQAADLPGFCFPLTCWQHSHCRVVLSIGKNRPATPVKVGSEQMIVPRANPRVSAQ